MISVFFRSTFQADCVCVTCRCNCLTCSPFPDPIDIVKDVIAPHEYLAEEDPKLYKSAKTQRGPLSDNWIQEISHNPGNMPVMCAYKLCKVEFRYWGMQSKIERFIHDVGAYNLLEISIGNPPNTLLCESCGGGLLLD